MDMHHIITDGVSQQIFVKEFSAFYDGDSLPALPALQCRYRDYAEWQSGKIQRDHIKQQEKYWLERYAGDIPVLNLPIDFSRPVVQSFEGKYILFSIDKEATIALNALATYQDATLYMVLLSLFTLLIAKLSGQEDIIIGSPSAGRRHADLQLIIGMFVNTLVMRNHPTGDKTLRNFLQEVKECTLQAFENQDYQFEDLVEKVSVSRDTAHNPLFDVMFALQNMDEKGEATPVSPEDPFPYKNEKGIAKFDITLVAVEMTNSIDFSFGYCTALFKEETIRRFITYFKNIVSIILENPDRRIADIEILTTQERQQILFDFNESEKPYPNDITIPRLFEEQVERTPENIAVVGVTPENERRELTYRELNEHALQLTRYLLSIGAAENELVGLMVNRSIEMIVGILGILKAGCGYVPLNPKAPSARSEYILQECSSKRLVTTRNMTSKIDFEIETIFLDGQDYDLDDASISLPTPGFNDLAYVIFTSGSTGKPKGVPITHSNFCPLIHWGYRDLGINSDDRFIQNLSYYFDWSVWEIVLGITTGASLYMVPDELLLNPAVCIPFMNDNRITVLHITPSQYLYFINAGHPLETLKYLFLGAEKLSIDLLRRSIESVNAECRVFNMYGPTECTIIAAVLEIDRSGEKTFENISSIPIGIPTGNTSLLVLDRYLNLCPVNVTGELYISGDCVAQGYLNRPELTSEFFIRSTRTYWTNRSNSLFYKTGDLVKWLPDGNIEFFGRIDLQVKIRGFRIELGEIESRLVTHPSVREAVVIDLQKENGEKYLCAYIVFKSPVESSELKEHLSDNLPDYMIPSHFITIESIPLNPNGKLDRKALPKPVRDDSDSEAIVFPRNETEEKLAAAWARVLEIDKNSIGIDEDFFRLGGHSLKATVMISEISGEFKIKVPLVQVFTTPTIRKLAAYIEENSRKIPFSGDEKSVLLREAVTETEDVAPNLFFIHDGTGEVEGYIDFCNHLEIQFNCWGIRAERFQNPSPRNITIPSLAKEYIGTMKKIQSEGPYRIAGWSLGGTIAFEIANQLEMNGESVQFLALIDSPPPQEYPINNFFEFTRASELHHACNYFPDNREIKKKLAEQPDIDSLWISIIKYLEENHFDLDILKQSIPGNLASVIPNVDRLSIRQLVEYFNLIRSLDRARQFYLPSRHISTPVLYFAASESKMIPKAYWNKFTNSPIKYLEIEGDHFSIFRLPGTSNFAKMFSNQFI